LICHFQDFVLDGHLVTIVITLQHCESSPARRQTPRGLAIASSEVIAATRYSSPATTSNVKSNQLACSEMPLFKGHTMALTVACGEKERTCRHFAGGAPLSVIPAAYA
jgi:hypothetical protein